MFLRGVHQGLNKLPHIGVSRGLGRQPRRLPCETVDGPQGNQPRNRPSARARTPADRITREAAAGAPPAAPPAAHQACPPPASTGGGGPCSCAPRPPPRARSRSCGGEAAPSAALSFGSDTARASPPEGEGAHVKARGSALRRPLVLQWTRVTGAPARIVRPSLTACFVGSGVSATLRRGSDGAGHPALSAQRFQRSPRCCEGAERRQKRRCRAPDGVGGVVGGEGHLLVARELGEVLHRDGARLEEEGPRGGVREGERVGHEAKLLAVVKRLGGQGGGNGVEAGVQSENEGGAASTRRAGGGKRGERGERGRQGRAHVVAVLYRAVEGAGAGVDPAAERAGERAGSERHPAGTPCLGL